MLDITQVPPPRVPILDARTGTISREWYRFMLSLYNLTGAGSNTDGILEIKDQQIEGQFLLMGA